MKKVLFVVTTFLACSTVFLKAQVTIGSDIEPTKAALLELKTQQANADNVTSNKGGLLLPRVQLLDLATFEPFIERTSAEWVNTATRDSLCRVLKGLMVYNIGTGAVPGSGLSEGVLIWTGVKWEKPGATAWLQPVLTQAQSSDAHATNTDSVIATAARVTIGSKTHVAKKFSQLELTGTTSGLRLPQIENEAQRDVIEALFKRGTIVDEAAAGLVIFNKESGSIEYWDGENWSKPVTKLPEVQHTSSNLQQNTTTTIGGNDVKNGEGGTELDFGTIQIPESGFYAFAFRFHGEINNAAYGTASATYYLSLWKNSSDYAARQDNLKDIVVIDILSFQKTPYFTGLHTYSITMSGYFEKNDMVKIKMANDPDPNLEWVLEGIPTGITAARTSMIWWKL